MEPISTFCTLPCPSGVLGPMILRLLFPSPIFWYCRGLVAPRPVHTALDLLFCWLCVGVCGRDHDRNDDIQPGTLTFAKAFGTAGTEKTSMPQASSALAQTATDEKWYVMSSDCIQLAAAWIRQAALTHVLFLSAKVEGTRRARTYIIPMAKITEKPIRLLFDICRLHITFCGSAKIAMSITRFTAAVERLMTLVSRQDPGIVLSQFRLYGVHATFVRMMAVT